MAIEIIEGEYNRGDTLSVTRLSDPQHAVYINKGYGEWNVVLGIRDDNPPEGQEPFLHRDTFPEPNFMIAGSPTDEHVRGIERWLRSERVSRKLIMPTLDIVQSMR